MPQLRFAAVRVAAATIAAVVLSSTLTAATTDTRGFVLRSSKTVTTAGLTRPFAAQEGVVGVALTSSPNYCLAWLDRRQGGAILFTTIYGGAIGVSPDPAGQRLGDPLGVSIAVSDTPPLGVLESGGGCIVLVRRNGAVDGVLVPHSGSTDPHTIFSLTNPGEFLASSNRAAIFQSGATLTLVTSEGVVTQRGSAPAVAAATAAGDRFFLAAREGSSLALWAADPSLNLTRLGGGIATTTGASVRLAASGSGVLVVSTGAPSGPTPFTMVHVSTSTGAVLQQINGAIPITGTLRRAYYDGTRYLVEWTTIDGTWVAETDGSAVQNQYSMAGVFDHLALSTGPTLHVWNRRNLGTTFELVGGTPTRNGTPITVSPQPEQLVDASAGIDEVALVWYEILPVEKKQQLWFGMYSKTNGALTPRAQLTDEPYDPAIPPSAAVAVRDRVIMIVWSDQAGAWFQRLHVDGYWLDKSPQLLRARGVGLGAIEITANGLDATPNGWIAAWSEWKDARTTGIGAASITAAGTATTYNVSVTPYTAYPAHVAIAATSRGAVIGWSDLAAPLPSLDGVQVYPVTVAAYDNAFAYLQDLTPAGGLTAINGLVLDSGKNTVLMVSDFYAWLYGDPGMGAWTRPQQFDLSVRQTQFGDRAPRLSATWTGTEYLIAMHAWKREGGPATSVAFISDEGVFVPQALPTVPDLTFGETLAFTPYGFVTAGGQILLFGSEVMDDEGGMVRRVRVNTFGTPVRRRSAGK